MHHRPEVHAVGVCDDPNYFYNKMDHIFEEMGYSPITTEENSSVTYQKQQRAASNYKNDMRDWVKIHQGRGNGYGQSTTEEMDFIQQFAHCTGIALDPVYTGKELYHFVHKVAKEDPEKYRNSRVLFWHTGGSIGLQVHSSELMLSLKQSSPVNELNVYGKKQRINGNDAMQTEIV